MTPEIVQLIGGGGEGAAATVHPMSEPSQHEASLGL